MDSVKARGQVYYILAAIQYTNMGWGGLGRSEGIWQGKGADQPKASRVSVGNCIYVLQIDLTFFLSVQISLF